MSVPSFGDLGKSARDVFRTGYHYGRNLIKLTARAKSSEQLEVGSDLSLDIDALKLSGGANTKYNMKDYGNFLERWTADGTLTIGYSLHGNPVPDVGLLSEISYNPSTSAKTIKIGANCAKELLNAHCAVSSDMNSNVNILGSIVTSVKGLLIGYQGGYSTELNKMTKNDIGMAFSYRDVGFHFRCTSIPNEYGLALMYKVNEEWDAAMDGILARGNNAQVWTLGAAAKCKLDESSTFRCKFNTDLQLGVSLQQKLDDNVTMSMSFNIDCANVTRGGHKIGLAIEMEA